jgi:hypothetical protein
MSASCHKRTSDERKLDVSLIYINPGNINWFDVAAVDFPSAEEFTMAEINKLSVGKVLDKLRSNDAPKRSKDEKARATEEELQRLRAATRRLKGTFKKPPA